MGGSENTMYTIMMNYITHLFKPQKRNNTKNVNYGLWAISSSSVSPLVMSDSL